MTATLLRPATAAWTTMPMEPEFPPEPEPEPGEPADWPDPEAPQPVADPDRPAPPPMMPNDPEFPPRDRRG
jgi:hypothetical protein